MASVRSLGLHEPSALHYLVAEGILPEDASRSTYNWSQHPTLDEDGLVVSEEVLHTSHCAVWSRNGLVKRVFNLDIEGEPILHAFITTFVDGLHDMNNYGVAKENTKTLKQKIEPSMVVILKTQAHIFMLSGDAHVIPLSFDVGKALPCSGGFIVQRTMSGEVAGFNPQKTQETSEHRPGSLLRYDDNFNSSTKTSRIISTFCVTELLSELGLVVAGSARRHENLEDCPPLPPAEELLYISRRDEVGSDICAASSRSVLIAVTVNRKTSEFSIWHVVFRSSESASARDQGSERKSSNYRRQSSNVHERQNITGPGSTRIASTFLESFGGTERPFFDAETKRDNAKNFKLENLAQQLGQEFEQSGVQTRSARRVSSMLARTDLGGVNDRSAFNEMALGPSSRKSLSRTARMEGSIGSFSDRQSFGARRRSSFPVATSILSNSTSFLGVPGRLSLVDIPAEITDDYALEDSASNLPKDIGFMKLKSLPCENSSESASGDSFEVLTLISPESPSTEDKQSQVLSVCLLERAAQKMTIVNIALKIQPRTKYMMQAGMPYELKAVEVQSGSSISDACTITAGSIQRLLIHSRTTQGQSVFHLEAPWSPSYRIDFPSQYVIHHPTLHAPADYHRSRDIGLHRVIPGVDVQLSKFITTENDDKVIFLDQRGRSHQLGISLVPKNDLVQTILDLCHFILPEKQRDTLLVAYWEVYRWLETQECPDEPEWTSIVISLFLMAVPFIGHLQDRAAVTQRRKKSALLRSSSGTAVDLENWDEMNNVTTSIAAQTWTTSPSWKWSNDNKANTTGIKSPGKHSRTASVEVADSNKSNAFLIRCVNLSRDFLQSPAGESMTGPEGYLPTAIGKERDVRRTSLASILVGLHLLREEQKLDNLTSGASVFSNQNLAICIVQLGSWLRWNNWTISMNTYYSAEIIDPDKWLLEHSQIDSLETPAEPFEPPSILKMIENAIAAKPLLFPTLLDLVHRPKNKSSDTQLRSDAAKLTPRTFAIISFLNSSIQNRDACDVIKLMLRAGLSLEMLNTLPDGILAVCQRASSSLQSNSHLFQKNQQMISERKVKEALHQNQQYTNHGPHESVRDFRTLGISALECESLSRWDMSSEMDRQTVTRLIFGQDRRFQEASKLVNQTRPPEVEFTADPNSNESNLLEAQKQLAQYVTRRTLAVATGRGMMHFNARTPLLTERVPIPAFSLQCVMKPASSIEGSQAMTFSADKALFTEDKVCWAFFHNGASAGLMISRDAKWIDTSWILYNKPAELTNRHAGFLLALGLNGHLRSLAKWVAFKYLTTKHTMTSVGLLLGLAASYIGTADTSITRLLSVHVPCLLPPGAPELNLSPPTQATGVMSIGLLYCGSQHRGMSEVMLSEIENRDAEEQAGDEPILRDEGYRLAAGLSLGMINLGQGLRLHALHDMHVVERLLSIAVGTKNVNLVHVLDRATAGAVIAVAFIFMKTNDAAVARKIDIPDTTHQFDYVRPDIFLLRTLAKHLILWDFISPDFQFLQKNLLPDFQHRADLQTTRKLSTNDLPFFNVLAGMCFAIALRFAGSQRMDARNLLISYLDQFLRLSRLPALNYDSKVTLNGVRNCLDILALSAATVMAGSGDLEVLRRLRSLHGRTDKDTPFGSHLAAHMAIGALFLSGGTATFGTSNLAIASLVIAFYPLFPNDVLDNRSHLQALRHLWVLAVEARCLITRDTDTGQILSGIMAEVHMRDGHIDEMHTPGLLSDFDHIRSIKIGTEGYEEFEINFDERREKSDLTVRDHYKKLAKGIGLSLKRRALYNRSDGDLFTAELQALDEARGVPNIDANAAINEKWRHGQAVTGLSEAQKVNSIEWVFNLDAFKTLDHSERALVLETNSGQVSVNKGIENLDNTVVDSKLEFEHGILGVQLGVEHEALSEPVSDRHVIGRDLQNDKLWQLRLLLAWADHWEQQEEQNTAKAGETTISNPSKTDETWLRQEVIDKLRWRLWKMSGETDDS